MSEEKKEPNKQAILCGIFITILASDIDTLGLSPRVATLLKRIGIEKVRDIYRKEVEHGHFCTWGRYRKHYVCGLIKFRTLGKTALEEINKKLGNVGPPPFDFVSRVVNDENRNPQSEWLRFKKTSVPNSSAGN